MWRGGRKITINASGNKKGIKQWAGGVATADRIQLNTKRTQHRVSNLWKGPLKTPEHIAHSEALGTKEEEKFITTSRCINTRQCSRKKRNARQPKKPHELIIIHHAHSSGVSPQAIPAPKSRKNHWAAKKSESESEATFLGQIVSKTTAFPLG